MAIDSRDKRASVLGLVLGLGRVQPLADGALGAADRLHLAGLYRGIAAATPTTPVESGPSITLAGVGGGVSIAGAGDSFRLVA